MVQYLPSILYGSFLRVIIHSVLKNESKNIHGPVLSFFPFKHRNGQSGDKFICKEYTM